jgi:toxin ParE1/3/4
VKAKPLVLRELADGDIRRATDQYRETSGPEFALRFIDALEFAFRNVATHPALGSPCYAAELDMPELRVWRLKRLPYLIFYVETEHGIDVWRVLSTEREIAEWLLPA